MSISPVTPPEHVPVMLKEVLEMDLQYMLNFQVLIDRKNSLETLNTLFVQMFVICIKHLQIQRFVLEKIIWMQMKVFV